ncbi:hypothetical protein INT47_002270 [Mucor saturninus]|uniref:H/ACA ribonucleoprotein complex non-core subunit NAF1 n=1 Tax=Mucor saturninus TaxID=64648 RepID=A0A8H7QZE5_9FUNG|nr:hypothetical protein INT47_002270 [Mucor saturninus]
MSIPNDLEFASTFAQQDIPVPAQVVAEVKKEKVSNNEPEPMQVDSDALDAALSGKAVKEEGYESSDLELSSDEESSDSSEEEEDEEEEEDTKGDKTELLDDDDEVFPDGIVKTAHEIVDIVVERPTFELTPQTEIILAGTIFQMIDNVIVIHCRPGSEYSTLDQGSLLVYENRELMGEVFETFGPVARPYYSVRFNDAKEINEEFGKIGASVYYVPTYQKTQIVETEALRKIKGTDASNVYDEEVGEEEMEFSDDEKEMQFKKKRNREKKMKKNGGIEPVDMGRPMKFQRRQPRPPRDLPSDFDSALAAYEGSQLPPRQQQSYADLEEYTAPVETRTQVQFQARVPQPAPMPQQQAPMPQQQAPQSSYQSPADLVSALFKSYNGQLPTQLPTSQAPAPQPSQPTQPAQPIPLAQPVPSAQPAQQHKVTPLKAAVRSLFAAPPPPIDDSKH